MCIIPLVVILILLLVTSALMVYIAQSNLMPVTLQLGSYVFSDIPLFYVIVGSLLVGLTLAYLMYLINSIFVSFSIYGKDSKIKKSNDEIAELTKRIHQLELENEKLKKHSLDSEDEKAL